MSRETVPTLTAEERVFGNAYSLSSGRAGDEVVSEFFGDRVKQVRETGTGWIPRALDSDFGVVADLFRDGTVIATVEQDFESVVANLYITFEGQSEDRTAIPAESFEDAVATAELIY